MRLVRYILTTVFVRSPEVAAIMEEGNNSSCLRRWTFTVRCSDVASECETLAITGDCPQLGSWSSGAVLPMILGEGGDTWSLALDLPTKDVSYRYAVCSFTKDPHRNSVRSWETSLKPRIVAKGATVPTTDTYGENGKVERGWLTYDSIVQLKFHRSPFNFKSKESALRIKVLPVNYFSPEDSSCAFVEVATLNSPADCKFRSQEQFGRVYNTGDFILFNVSSPNVDSLAYHVDFYKTEDPPLRLGSAYILPSMLKNTEGRIELPIGCDSTHRPLGSMVCEYLIVRPMPNHLCDMSVSYSTHWSRAWTGLEVGHRGSGSSFKKESNSIRENTIASLKNAASSGADMIEFDVQLSKDLVPVVYHDFHVCVGLKQKNQVDHTEMLEIPMQDLTVEQLQKLKVLHVVEGRANQQRFFDEHLAEHQPFPRLAEVLRAIDPHVGFNIEIKGTMSLEDGTKELDHPIDLNVYLDKILDVVLRSGRSRHIVFSSFQPDICTMLRLKQNLYPTMFLTQGVTTRYPSYQDVRCNTIPAAMNHALNAGLLGIVVHTEDILRDASQVKPVIDAGLIIFCWGEDNNNKDTIKYLKQLGLHGVIFDKLDQYSTKEIKESIFLVEAREAQKELVKIANNDEQRDVACDCKNSSSNKKTTS